MTEAIVTAIIAGIISPLIALIPVYWKLQQDIKQRQVEREQERLQRDAEITDVSKATMISLIQQQSVQIDNLKKENEELEGKLDIERGKRRKVEDDLDQVRRELDAHIAENHKE